MDLNLLKRNQGISFELKKKAIEKSRKCSLFNCTTPSILSHTIQKSKLKEILAPDGHVYTIDSTGFIEVGTLSKFKKVGVGNALTFKGFCSVHDNQIFQPVERINADFTTYESFLLFSFRAVMNEIRKKEIIIDWFESLLNHPKLHVSINKENVKAGLRGQLLGIQDLKYVEDEILNEIARLPNHNRSFVYKVLILPSIPVCGSAIYNEESFEDMASHTYGPNGESPLNSRLIHIIPDLNSTYLIIGYHSSFNNKNSQFFSELEQRDNSSLLSLANDLLVKRIESWACSTQFYLEKVRPVEEEFLRLFSHPNTKRFMESQLAINILS
ncbi:hypothetical protein [Adhaeribacter pallidiroseus]|uniref:Uncharacterized protein n=1 Tax=Adhaeribacter pallidiroseus TaxID=2072847 RepID=A0A369QNM8_9BACT|nr:hypothetical protein [Adhaeribacter pallidiroseus]RDC64867.1 hypothetical protein AHMF7616_03488 [Adhaeribacter pallidiroseus]